MHVDFLSPAAGATAFQSGKVDAWAIWNPQISLAVQQGAADHRQGAAAHRSGQQLLRRAEQGPDRAEASGVLTDLFERLAAEFAWAVKHPGSYAEALSQEDSISLADAKAIVPASEWYIAPVKAADIQAEQALSDAFFEAGQIKTQVNFTHIAQNILPPGYDSLNTPGT